MIKQQAEIIKSAIQAAGGARAIARELDLSASSVHMWYVNGVPAKRVLWLCRASGNVVTPSQLRPDVFGAE